eukprot:3445167-Rhodomonas_salina.1
MWFLVSRLDFGVYTPAGTARVPDSDSRVPGKQLDWHEMESRQPEHTQRKLPKYFKSTIGLQNITGMPLVQYDLCQKADQISCTVTVGSLI